MDHADLEVKEIKGAREIEESKNLIAQRSVSAV
jgi:hypothetical protein